MGNVLYNRLRVFKGQKLSYCTATMLKAPNQNCIIFIIFFTILTLTSTQAFIYLSSF